MEFDSFGTDKISVERHPNARGVSKERFSVTLTFMRNALHVYLFSLVLLSYMVIVYSAKLKKIEKMMQQAQTETS